MRLYRTIALAGVSLASLTTPAFAAEAAPVAAEPAADAAADTAKPDSEIVVTGTLIRGTAVVGSQTITIDQKIITDKAATSTNELLSVIPQIANNFNGRPEGDPRGYAAGISTTRPNLRSLPSTNSTSGALTLLLVDGMRVAPVGVNQASLDPDVVPTVVLEGVDVVTDGGTSLYGADAVAGVINFRTRKKFDGFKIDGNFGFGTTIKGFHEYDVSGIAGKSWATGNAYVAVSHANRDNVLNGETTWASGLVYNAAGVGAFTFTQCPTPVGTETRWFRFGPGAAQFTNNPAAPGAGTFPVGTPCDATSSQSYSPLLRRTNVYGAITQQVAENIDFRMTAYFSKRDIELSQFPRGFTAAGSPLTTGALVGAAFPGAAVGSVTAIPGGTSFSFSPNAANRNLPQRIGFETWGVSPELDIKLGGDWHVRNNLHYGRSTNFQDFPGVDAVKAQCYITGCTGIAAGQLSPFNVAAASGAVITDIENYTNIQQTTQQLFVFRTVADGSLLSLPAGNVKLAVGAEYQDNSAKSRLTAGPVGSINALPYMSAGRNSKSLFGEVLIPVASFLDVTGSVRFDSYSDFGHTTNPNVGVTFKPVSWFKAYGHYNTSYNAPTAVDDLAIATGRFVCGIYVPGGTVAQRPTDPLGRDTLKQGSCALVLQGSGPGLKPQTSKNFALGFEVTPTSNFRFGGEFYSIDLQNALGTLNPSNLNTYSTNPNLYTYNPQDPTYQAILKTLTNGGQLGAQQAFSNVAIVVDTRTSNLNAAKVKGIDFHANFDADTSFGRLSLGVSGTQQTKAQITKGGVTTDERGNGGPRFSAVSFVALKSGGASARVTVYYTGKYHDQAQNNLGLIEVVNPFVVANLNLGYEFGENSGVLAGTSLRLVVNNLFEALPQTIKRGSNSFNSYNNYTLGRVIKVGFSKTF
ncbi:TonB-dependent receptor [Novosphingobium sp.]|uniref:TonB-dependent receptor domain-containing protein n=1 Tax=Novosphingobium sp. TaxID=1874826 RepID=UPI0025D63C64|nr:TonB-dependent receptor [Novosphingobium sp.]